MFGLHSSLLVLCATLVVVCSADLISSLMQRNIIFLAPGYDGYPASSAACTFDHFLCYPASHNSTVNLRFTYKPAAITFPKNTQDVSTIIQIAQEFSYSVVARSGGVRLFIAI